MIKIFKNSKIFRLFWAHFSHFWATNFFFQKSHSVTHNFTFTSTHIPITKKRDSEKMPRQTNGWKDGLHWFCRTLRPLTGGPINWYILCFEMKLKNLNYIFQIIWTKTVKQTNSESITCVLCAYYMSLMWVLYQCSE